MIIYDASLFIEFCDVIGVLVELVHDMLWIYAAPQGGSVHDSGVVESLIIALWTFLHLYLGFFVSF